MSLFVAVWGKLVGILTVLVVVFIVANVYEKSAESQFDSASAGQLIIR